jgi:hypothetical protein
LNAAKGCLLVVVVLERWGYGSDDPVADGEAIDKDTATLMGKMSKVEGWGLGGFMLSFTFQTT